MKNQLNGISTPLPTTTDRSDEREPVISGHQQEAEVPIVFPENPSSEPRRPGIFRFHSGIRSTKKVASTYLCQALDSIEEKIPFILGFLKDRHDEVVQFAVERHEALLERFKTENQDWNTKAQDVNKAINDRVLAAEKYSKKSDRLLRREINSVSKVILCAHLKAAATMGIIGQPYNPKDPQSGVRQTNEPQPKASLSQKTLYADWTTKDWFTSIVIGIVGGLTLGVLSGAIDLRAPHPQILQWIIWSLVGIANSVLLKTFIEALWLSPPLFNESPPGSAVASPSLRVRVGLTVLAVTILTILDSQGILAFQTSRSAFAGFNGGTASISLFELLIAGVGAAVMAFPYICSTAARSYRFSEDRDSVWRFNEQVREQKAKTAKEERSDPDVQAAIIATSQVAVLLNYRSELDTVRKQARAEAAGKINQLNGQRMAIRDGFSEKQTALLDESHDQVVGLNGEFVNLLTIIGEEKEPSRIWREVRTPGYRLTIRRLNRQVSASRRRPLIWILGSLVLLVILGLFLFYKNRM